MAKIAFVATVQILVDAGDPSEAADSIHEILQSTGDVMIDWGYLKVGAQRMTPSEKIIEDNYKEGDMWK